MAKITGIGGIFLQSGDPKRLTAWYAEHLGLPLTAWGGASLLWKDDTYASTGETAWTAVAENSDSFGNKTQSVMINYRVDDLETLLAALQEAGVWIDPKREDSEFGRFAWIKDCDGNRVELWEPTGD